MYTGPEPITPIVMRRIARTLLVFCTAFAAFVASSLQGNVVCYAEGGQHVAIEAPHPDSGCPGGHEEHRESSTGDEPEQDHCTDVSAKFSAARETSSRSTHAHYAESAMAPALLITPLAPSVDLPIASRKTGVDPGPSELGCLRTIILVV